MPIGAVISSVFACVAAQTHGVAPSVGRAEVRWDVAAAAHLLDRAGFGATREEIDAAARAGLEATVERLFHPAGVKLGDEPPRFLPGRLLHPEDVVRRIDDRRRDFLELHSDYTFPLGEFGQAWIDGMLAGSDPLRDHLTLFWHGHFTTSFKELDDPYKMIAQIRFLRENALGPFDVLVRGIARDPAMLLYLNNDKNVEDHPNENWARELLELFTLGEGHYTEKDIKEVARAFTGWAADERQFRMRFAVHDDGRKAALGITGELDGDHVIEAILASPECGRHLARQLLVFFEGADSRPDRVETYAEILRSNGYAIRALLERLFRDPDFYREDIRDRRVAGPVELFVAASRRLGIRVPGTMLSSVADLCGQRLFYPPSVKGWDPGLAWITTDSLLQRSNGIGILLGLVDVDTLKVDPEFADAASAMDRPPANNQALISGLSMLHEIQASGWTPDLSLQRDLARSGVAADEGAVADALLRKLLPGRVGPTTRDLVVDFLRTERERAGIPSADLLVPSSAGEVVLRRAAHVVLSLPEAQFN